MDEGIERVIIPLNNILKDIKKLTERNGLVKTDIALLLSVIFDEVNTGSYETVEWHDDFAIDSYRNYLEDSYKTVSEEAFDPKYFENAVYDLIWDVLYSMDGDKTRRKFNSLVNAVNIASALSEELKFAYFTERNIIIAISS